VICVFWCSFAFYNVDIWLSASLYCLLAFWNSSTIFSSCIFRLPLNSSRVFVLAVWVFSSSFIRSVDLYTNEPTDLSNLSRFSRIVEIVTRVVELAFLSDNISYLFSVMPACIS